MCEILVVIALCRFLLRKNVNRKIQSSCLILFRFICCRQKYLKCTFHFLLRIWVQVDRTLTSQQIYERTSSNSIRKKTGCDEYLEDQLNVAGKNLAKYTLDEKDGRNNLEDIFLWAFVGTNFRSFGPFLDCWPNYQNLYLTWLSTISM